MHRVDADANVSNMFDEGDPLVPRNPTQIDADWLNAVQEELANAIEGLGVTLVKGTNNQLESALRGEFVDKTNAQTSIGGVKTWVAQQILNILVNGATNAWALTNAGTGGGVKVTTVEGLALHLNNVAGGTPTMKLAPLAAIPSLNASGAALGAGDAGSICYVGGALNKLYCWDGSGWNPCW